MPRSSQILTRNIEEDKPLTDPRESVLRNAEKAVMADRNQQYGDPEDNFNDIAGLWTAYSNMWTNFGAHDAVDVAVMMILVKIARLKTSPSVEDHWIDIAGYAACGYQAALSQENPSA